MLASGLIAGGMNWFQAVGTILLGNLIVLIPMLLNAHAGTRYGIPFRFLCALPSVFVVRMCRRCFALWWHAAGSAFSRWIGGQAIYSMLRIVWPERGIFPAHIGVLFLFLGHQYVRGVEGH